ncbi:MAG: family 1 glycosylhydrolase, partial [Patescibacteria group bacterium]
HEASRRFGKPIFVTENGIADAKDEKRAAFIHDHIMWMQKAIDERADVRGYFYWSLLDNFEWDSGFGPRFGLVEVDYKTLERKIRPSAWEYKKIIENGL